jgi:hypothetical protein
MPPLTQKLPPKNKASGGCWLLAAAVTNWHLFVDEEDLTQLGRYVET